MESRSLRTSVDDVELEQADIETKAKSRFNFKRKSDVRHKKVNNQKQIYQKMQWTLVYSIILKLEEFSQF